MKRVADFVKTCIVGGLVGILPILLTAFVLAEAIDLLDGISTPLAEKLPIEELGGIATAQIVALILIVAACFLAGLLLRTRWGMWSTRFVEGAVLKRLPGYQMFKTMTQRLGGLEEGALFSAALADLHGTEPGPSPSSSRITTTAATRCSFRTHRLPVWEFCTSCRASVSRVFPHQPHRR